MDLLKDAPLPRIPLPQISLPQASLPQLLMNSSYRPEVWRSVALQDHMAVKFNLKPLKKSPFAASITQKPSNPKSGSSITPVESVERECVLGSRAQPLTLAQKMGLLESPPPRLSSSQWCEVKLKSLDRHHHHQPCVICCEEFQLGSQVSDFA